MGAHLFPGELLSAQHFLPSQATVTPDIHPSEGGLHLPDGAQPVLELKPGGTGCPHLQTEQDGGVF